MQCRCFLDVWTRLGISIDDVELKLENVDFETDAQEDEDKTSAPKKVEESTLYKSYLSSTNKVKVDSYESKFKVLFVVVALVALSAIAVFIVVRKKKSRTK